MSYPAKKGFAMEYTCWICSVDTDVYGIQQHNDAGTRTFCLECFDGWWETVDPWGENIPAPTREDLIRLAEENE